MYSVLYKKNKYNKFHGNRYNGFWDTAITNSRPPAKFVRGAPVLQLAPGTLCRNTRRKLVPGAVILVSTRVP